LRRRPRRPRRLPRPAHSPVARPDAREERALMRPSSRGFRGRRRAISDPSRVPPAQYVDQRPSAAVGRSDAAHAAGGVELHGPRRGRRAGVLVVRGVPSAAIGDDRDRHPLRDQVVKARYELARGVAGHAARSGRHVGRLPPRSQTAATPTWRVRTSPEGARGWPTSSGASRLPQSTAVRTDCWSRTCTSGRAPSGCAG